MSNENYADRTPSQLLCTFVGSNGVNSTLHAIIKEFGDNIINGKIIVLKNKDTNLSHACIYNVEGESNEHRMRATILMHRNRSTDTLYTINSLNLLNEKLNNGTRVDNFVMPWDEYRQTMLLARDKELTIIETELSFVKHVD